MRVFREHAGSLIETHIYGGLARGAGTRVLFLAMANLLKCSDVNAPAIGQDNLSQAPAKDETTYEGVSGIVIGGSLHCRPREARPKHRDNLCPASQ